MKIISIAAVTAGGKTTIVNELLKKIPNSTAIYFDDYDFEGQPDDFYKWVKDGADYNVYNLEPLEKAVLQVKNDGNTDYLFLDYPFAYYNKKMKPYIDRAIFIDTPLDIALARGVLRDMKMSTAKEIMDWMQTYLDFARIAYLQMQKDIKPISDYVVDGTKSIKEIVEEIVSYI